MSLVRLRLCCVKMKAKGFGRLLALLSNFVVKLTHSIHAHTQQE